MKINQKGKTLKESIFILINELKPKCHKLNKTTTKITRLNYGESYRVP